MNKAIKYSWLFIIILIGTVWLMMPGSVVYSHANLVRSDPPADAVLPSGRVPNQVQLWFSEQPDPGYSEIRVVDSRNQLVNTGPLQVVRGNVQSLLVALKPDLPDGTYTVIWKTASAVDGHVVKSAFSFVAGNAGSSNATDAAVLAGLDNGPKVATGNDAANLSVVGVWVRWLNYVAGAMLLGCAGFGLLVWKPGIARFGQSSTSDDLTRSLTQRAWQRLNWLAGLALVGLVVGWAAALIYQLTIVTGSSWLDLQLYGSPLSNFVLNSRYGQIWLARLGLLVVAMLALNFALSNTAAQNRLHRRSWGALLGVGAAILLTTSLNSHSAAQIDYTWLLVSVDWLHLLATAFWIGGILSFVLVLPVAFQLLLPGTGGRTRLLTVLIPAFSRLALVSVLVLVCTGVYSSLIEVGSVEALFGTLYGQVLVAKLVLFGFTLALAAGNLWRISPKMSSLATANGGAKAGSVQAGRWQLRFKQSVALEAILLLAVLLSVGVLTSLEPARPPGGNAQPQAMVQTVAGINFNLAVTPGQAGVNNFVLKLSDVNGGTIVNPSLVQLRFQMLEMDMGQPTLTLKPAQPGVFTGTGAILSMVGTWRLQVLVQRVGQNDVIVPFQFQVSH